MDLSQMTDKQLRSITINQFLSIKKEDISKLTETQMRILADTILKKARNRSNILLETTRKKGLPTPLILAQTLDKGSKGYGKYNFNKMLKNIEKQTRNRIFNYLDRARDFLSASTSTTRGTEKEIKSVIKRITKSLDDSSMSSKQKSNIKNIFKNEKAVKAFWKVYNRAKARISKELWGGSLQLQALTTKYFIDNEVYELLIRLSKDTSEELLDQIVDELEKQNDVLYYLKREEEQDEEDSGFSMGGN